jgi:hypothetical protein
MPVTVQIHNVPKELHRRLNSRAEMMGMSLSDYLLAELRSIADVSTPEEMRARLALRAAVDLDVAEMIQQERDRP